VKLVSFKGPTGISYGLLQGEGIVDAGRHLGEDYPTLKSALATPDRLKALVGAATDVTLGEVQLLPPVPDPGRILCIGLNYKSHIAETGRDIPKYPMLFPRYPDSLVGSGEAMLRPLASERFDFEGELAFVIGKGGRRIAAADALSHVAGYACFNDGSIRDYQRHTTQFLPGKNFWRSGSFGPWICTPDEVGDIGKLELVTRLNGAEMQRAKLDDLLFGIADLITYISTFLPLEPGDVIATGTAGGVGIFREPPLFMKAGDVVEVEIDRLGLLCNPIVDEAEEVAPS
jgi:2-keto-4-pentenoate hydratase/2-oxohepta-3-ene-1,7-dioic acid hydratase in catechol pathway